MRYANNNTRYATPQSRLLQRAILKNYISVHEELSHAFSTKVCVCFQKKKEVLVVVITVTVILILSEAIVIKMSPRHTGLIPPKCPLLSIEAKRVGGNSTYSSEGPWSGSPLRKRRFCSDLKLNNGV